MSIVRPTPYEKHNESLGWGDSEMARATVSSLFSDRFLGARRPGAPSSFWSFVEAFLLMLSSKLKLGRLRAALSSKSFWTSWLCRSPSSKGIGSGVVQNASPTLGGRPVIPESEVSSTYSAHHTLYLISFDNGATLWLSLRRW